MTGRNQALSFSPKLRAEGDKIKNLTDYQSSINIEKKKIDTNVFYVHVSDQISYYERSMALNIFLRLVTVIFPDNVSPRFFLVLCSKAAYISQYFGTIL